jgi:uncharacterized protein (DUF983 family)
VVVCGGEWCWWKVDGVPVWTHFLHVIPLMRIPCLELLNGAHLPTKIEGSNWR